MQGLGSNISNCMSICDIQIYRVKGLSRVHVGRVRFHDQSSKEDTSVQGCEMVTHHHSFILFFTQVYLCLFIFGHHGHG